MKIFTRRTTIWISWILVLVALIIYFTLQYISVKSSLIKCLMDSCITISVPYIFFTTFYVATIVSKQYRKIIYLFIVDILSSLAIIYNIGYFYEGPLVARNSFLVIGGVMFIKGMILLIKR